MGVTIPEQFAEVASLVGVPGEVFLWDEDKLDDLSDTLGLFLRDVAPGIQTSEHAAAGFAESSGGAAGEAFSNHWQATADGGQTGDLFQTAGWVASLLGVAAGAIRLAKTGVIARLAWCARQLAASTIAAGAGAINAARAVLAARVSIGSIVEKITSHLRQFFVPKLRKANDVLRSLSGRARKASDAVGTRLANATGGPRLAFDGVPNHAPHAPESVGGTRMDMARKNKSDDEGFSWLPKRKTDEPDTKPGKAGKTCDHCGGTGQDPYKDNRTCPSCVGTGVNPH